MNRTLVEGCLRWIRAIVHVISKDSRRSNLECGSTFERIGVIRRLQWLTFYRSSNRHRGYIRRLQCQSLSDIESYRRLKSRLQAYSRKIHLHVKSTVPFEGPETFRA